MLTYRRGICSVGPHEALIVNRSRMLCKQHNDERLKKSRTESVAILNPDAKPRGIDRGLPGLIKQCDTVFSIYVRLKAANKITGMAQCYTCLTQLHWKLLQCGHFVPRGSLVVRYSTVNCKPQCENCNKFLNGNLDVFRANLVRDHGEIVVKTIEGLRNREHHFTRYELQQDIDEYEYLNAKLLST